MEVGLTTERVRQVQDVVSEHRQGLVILLLLRMEVINVRDQAAVLAILGYSVPSTVCGVLGERVHHPTTAELDPRVVQELDLSSVEPTVLALHLAHVIRELRVLPPLLLHPVQLL